MRTSFLSWAAPPPLLANIGDQLELGLFVNEPWEGKSPRGLTRGHLGIIFNPRGEKKDACGRLQPSQLLLWPAKKDPELRLERGSFTAETLLPLPGRGHGPFEK